MPKQIEKLTQVETTISRIANFAKIKNSKLVAKIKEAITPYALETIFRPITYTKKQQAIPYNATGNLAVNSLTSPNILNERHSLQK